MLKIKIFGVVLHKSSIVRVVQITYMKLYKERKDKNINIG